VFFAKVAKGSISISFENSESFPDFIGPQRKSQSNVFMAVPLKCRHREVPLARDRKKSDNVKIIGRFL
jgi:hypothetical protein